MASDFEERSINRLETIVDKLTEISGDLSRIVAVHEEKLSQHSKHIDALNDMTEKHQGIISDAIDRIRDETDRKLAGFRVELDDVRRSVWMLFGGIAVITFVVNYAGGFASILKVIAGH
jgi:methyl-accepting chemotaxis protein